MPENRSASHQVDKCGKLYQANISSDAPALLHAATQYAATTSCLAATSLWLFNVQRNTGIRSEFIRQ
jgi:hypothetical protein